MRVISCCCLLLSLLCRPAVAEPTGPFRFEANDQGVLLREAGRPVWFFQLKQKSLDGKWPRANYLHPLYGLDGETLTEDFPEDHRHHRGIFWAWHQLKQNGQPLADPWICEGVRWLPPENGDGDDGVDWSSDAQRATLRVVRHWTVQRDGRPQRVVEERVTVTAHRSDPKLRRLDFELGFRALVDSLEIGGSENVKGYGGFSTRLKLSEGIRFVGQRGEVLPKTTAVEAGWWLDIVHRRAGATHVALLCHDSHPHDGDAPSWILRSQRSMQNVAWPGRHAVQLPTDRPLALRYRLLLHSGPLDAPALDRHWREYVGR